MTEIVRTTFLNLPEAKQARIIEAALAEFADKGYPQASLNVIVARSGIAKGSLYQYFTDKTGIFLYIFDFAISMVRRLLVQVKYEEEDFFTRLEKSLLAGVAFIQQHPKIYGIYLKILFDQQVPQKTGTAPGGAPVRGGLPPVAVAPGPGPGGIAAGSAPGHHHLSSGCPVGPVPASGQRPGF